METAFKSNSGGDDPKQIVVPHGIHVLVDVYSVDRKQKPGLDILRQILNISLINCDI